MLGCEAGKCVSLLSFIQCIFWFRLVSSQSPFSSQLEYIDALSSNYLPSGSKKHIVFVFVYPNQDKDSATSSYFHREGYRNFWKLAPRFDILT